MENNICKHTEGYDCLDDAMALAFKKYNLNYNLVFVKSWCFNFERSSDTLGESLNGNRGDRFEIISDIFNLKLDCYTLKNKNDKYPLGDFLKLKYVDNIEELLKTTINEQNKELIVQYDTFYSPWDDLYKKFHGTHMCYINSITDEEVELFDSWYSTIKKITMEELLYMTYKFIVLDFSNSCVKMKEVKDVIRAIQEHTKFNKLEKSLTYYEENIKLLNLGKEFSNCTKFDYTKAPIMRNMKEYIYNEMQLSILFSELYKSEPIMELKNISDLFENNSKKIELLRMYIAKEFLMNSLKYSTEINELTLDIKKTEMTLVENFRKIIL